MVELVHRAVPYPVLLIAWRDGTPELSLAHKRRSLGEADKTVIDSEIIVARAYGDCVHTSRLRRFAMLSPWYASPGTRFTPCIRGGSIRWRLSARPRSRAHSTFRLRWQAAVDREAALREYRSLDDRIANMHSAASKEKQMSRRVAKMNMELARLRADRELCSGQTVRERRANGEDGRW